MIRCQACGSEDLHPGLDLGHQPATDLVSSADLEGPETLYPTRLLLCLECGLCQLGYVVDPDVVWRDFSFVSGTTATATRHLQGLAADLGRRLDLDAESLAVDIGSNDGTLLAGYAPLGARVLGIDPAELPVRAALERDIPTWEARFDDRVAELIVAEHGRAAAVSAAGCFAHVADLDGLMTGVRRLLAPGGIFCSDNQYWLDVVRHGHYDNVYHQHLRYYSLRPLVRLHEAYGLEVFDVDRSNVHGGSIRVYACRVGDRAISPGVEELLAIEDEAGLHAPRALADFELATVERRRRLVDEVHARLREGQKVIGVGAAAKATTVCNYCSLGPHQVEYVTDVNPLRVGKHLAGAHIPIIDEELMLGDPEPPDAAILFAWNYRHEIAPKLRARGWDGDLIEP